VRNDGPEKADIAVVLAGDYTGDRLMKGIEMVRAGYVPAILVSGPAGFFGRNECDFAIAHAVQLGYPREWFIPLPHTALSTREEAWVVLADLRRRGARRFLLVTSDYHTGRSARTFRSVERASGGGPDFRVIAAPDRHFSAGSWWRNRESRKTVFFEWSKTLAEAVGI
jgi:uncharacterized SAM-binding protein YcdF (DUF218 family)